MAPSKRKKQQLNRGIGGTSGLTRNEARDAIVAVQNERLLEFAEEFIQSGRRTYEEIAVHKEMQDKGETVRFLEESDIKDVNPLRIHLHRANDLRKYRKMPLLFGPSETHSHTLSVSDNSSNISRLHQERDRALPLQAEVTIRRQNSFNFNLNIETAGDFTSVQRGLQETISELTRNPPLSNNSVQHLNQPQVSTSIFQLNTLESSLPLRESHRPSREITINGTLLKFSNEDVLWPHGIISYTDNISQLFHDWHHSSLVKVKGVPIPLKYWAQLYHGVAKESWNTLKKGYSEQKSIMATYSIYSSETAFWEDFSTIDKSSKQNRHMKWVEIVSKIRSNRRRIDTEDAVRARAEYQGKSPGFNEVFVYRKGSKVEVYKSTPQIARKYRELKGESQPWDNNDFD